MIPTDEQQAILDRPPTGTVKVLAGAGCGKTSTLVAYGNRWPGRGLYLAFNTAIAQEAARKFPPHIEARTAHSFAYRQLGLHARKAELVKRYTTAHLDAFDDAIRAVPGLGRQQVRSAILATIDRFLIDEGTKIRRDHCQVENHAQNLAVRKIAGEITLKLLRFADHDLPITFDTYLKRFEMKHRITGFDYLLLDEAQDLNPVLISIARKAGIPTIVVGDPYQSIYRFRGAVDAMDAFPVEELTLTQSWRFGDAVARIANAILRHSAKPPRHRLSGNPAVETVVARYSGKVATLPDTAILARTNARLFESLATIDRPFHLVGGIRDLHKQLRSAHALSQGRLQGVTEESIARFPNWRGLQESAERGDTEMRRVRDIIDKHGAQLPSLLERLTQLHRDREEEAQIVVSTAHKAKGREWENVVVLDDFDTPADLAARRRSDAKKAVDADQQINLLYVACTRARRSLHLAPKLYDALV
ncbi:UvrD-helicase domain-containing protein [uncultured Sphingomonas sp.]|uniref:UvrD-helicase domain-containing protein n=1 Tax=uncultured Sphingomonas sp. TaxID=158754 RepID=UPI0025EF9951|nr:UvrD-helicase domain-containing protein [uncultured Sphingomonas sp.]